VAGDGSRVAATGLGATLLVPGGLAVADGAPQATSEQATTMPSRLATVARTTHRSVGYRGVMSMTLSQAALALIESDTVATIVTLDPDGAPHVSVAWIGIEDDEIVFGTLHDQRKFRNLRRDPRIVVSLQSERINAWGLREYLVVRGTARITEGGAPALLQHLAHRYLGPEVVFPAMPDPPPGFVTRVRVDRVSGMGPWQG
jgi:PPOX class probable F420-dependent enzyme